MSDDAHDIKPDGCRTTVVQTFIIACCNLAFSGGFALQLGALSNSTWSIMNTPTPLNGDSPEVYLSYRWIHYYMLLAIMLDPSYYLNADQ